MQYEVNDEKNDAVEEVQEEQEEQVQEVQRPRKKKRGDRKRRGREKGRANKKAKAKEEEEERMANVGEEKQVQNPPIAQNPPVQNPPVQNPPIAQNPPIVIQQVDEDNDYIDDRIYEQEERDSDIVDYGRKEESQYDMDRKKEEEEEEAELARIAMAEKKKKDAIDALKNGFKGQEAQEAKKRSKARRGSERAPIKPIEIIEHKDNEEFKNVAVKDKGLKEAREASKKKSSRVNQNLEHEVLFNKWINKEESSGAHNKGAKDDLNSCKDAFDAFQKKVVKDLTNEDLDFLSEFMAVGFCGNMPEQFIWDNISKKYGPAPKLAQRFKMLYKVVRDIELFLRPSVERTKNSSDDMDFAKSEEFKQMQADNGKGLSTDKHNTKDLFLDIQEGTYKDGKNPRYLPLALMRHSMVALFNDEWTKSDKLSDVSASNNWSLKPENFMKALSKVDNVDESQQKSIGEASGLTKKDAKHLSKYINHGEFRLFLDSIPKIIAKLGSPQAALDLIKSNKASILQPLSAMKVAKGENDLFDMIIGTSKTAATASSKNVGKIVNESKLAGKYGITSAVGTRAAGEGAAGLRESLVKDEKGNYKEVQKTIKVDTGRKDSNGNPIMEDKIVTEYEQEYIKPVTTAATASGLMDKATDALGKVGDVYSNFKKQKATVEAAEKLKKADKQYAVLAGKKMDGKSVNALLDHQTVLNSKMNTFCSVLGLVKSTSGLVGDADYAHNQGNAMTDLYGPVNATCSAINNRIEVLEMEILKLKNASPAAYKNSQQYKLLETELKMAKSERNKAGKLFSGQKPMVDSQAISGAMNVVTDILTNSTKITQLGMKNDIMAKGRDNLKKIGKMSFHKVDKLFHVANDKPVNRDALTSYNEANDKTEESDVLGSEELYKKTYIGDGLPEALIRDRSKAKNVKYFEKPMKRYKDEELGMADAYNRYLQIRKAATDNQKTSTSVASVEAEKSNLALSKASDTGKKMGVSDAITAFIDTDPYSSVLTDDVKNELRLAAPAYGFKDIFAEKIFTARWQEASLMLSTISSVCSGTKTFMGHSAFDGDKEKKTQVATSKNILSLGSSVFGILSSIVGAIASTIGAFYQKKIDKRYEQNLQNTVKNIFSFGKDESEAKQSLPSIEDLDIAQMMGGGKGANGLDKFLVDGDEEKGTGFTAKKMTGMIRAAQMYATFYGAGGDGRLIYSAANKDDNCAILQSLACVVG